MKSSGTNCFTHPEKMITSPSFTVEQVELMRRLRNSGVTCQQIIEAFQALDRIDVELGTLYSLPVSHSSNATVPNDESRTISINTKPAVPEHNGFQAHRNSVPPSSTSHQGDRWRFNHSDISVLTTMLNKDSILRNRSTQSATGNGIQAVTSHSTPDSSTATIVLATPTLGVSSHTLSRPGEMVMQSTSVPSSSPTSAAPSSKFSDVLKDVARAAIVSSATTGILKPHHNISSLQAASSMPSVNHHSFASSESRSSTSQANSNLATQKIHPMMNTDSKDGIAAACGMQFSKETMMELTGKFLMLCPDFDPWQQSLELGVAETAIRNFLSGDVHLLEPDVRYKIISWFIHKLKQNDSFPKEMDHIYKFQDVPEGLDVHFTPKRERFTFKEKHLEVLEKFFKLGQYPTQDEKEHIANECNIAMAAEVDRQLGLREKMTHINVTNWFSNRRKEIKRLARKDGVETEKVILPSRVKPKIISHNLPTYDELENEQRHRLFLASHGITSGAGLSYSSVHSETDSSPSQDNSMINLPYPVEEDVKPNICNALMRDLELNTADQGLQDGQISKSQNLTNTTLKPPDNFISTTPIHAHQSTASDIVFKSNIDNPTQETLPGSNSNPEFDAGKIKIEPMGD